MVLLPGVHTNFWQEAALNAMTSISHRIDYVRGGQPFFWTDLKAKPPVLKHQSWDYCDMSGRWLDALIRGRLMTGSTSYLSEELRLSEFLLSRVGEDGLFYNEGAPEFGSTYAADIFCQSRVFLGLNTWFQNSKLEKIEILLTNLASRLCDIAHWDGKYAWFPGSEWRNNQWIDADQSVAQFDPKVAPALKAPGYRTALLGGLVEYVEMFGDKSALELARGLAYHYVERSQAVKRDHSFQGHTHSGGVLPTVLGVLRCGMASDDEELINWAQKTFEFTISQSSSFGWLADGVGFAPDYFWGQFSETCALADFIEIGVLLSENSIGDYWEVIEKCARNQLIENQIKDLEGLFSEPVSEELELATLGSFACSALPNSYLGWEEGLEGCCIGSGIRAAYLFWRHGVQNIGNRLVVNVPISRKTELASVLSEDPYRGSLKISMQQSGSVDLRRPSQDSKPLEIYINGARNNQIKDSKWLNFENLSAGDNLVINYDLPVHTEKSVIMGKEYSIDWRGRTVTHIDPPGDRCRTYQRVDFRDSVEPIFQEFASAESQEALLPW